MSEPFLPLSGDQVDELLSAELDGEFDAAAADAGLTPDDARRRLDATPGVEARRNALAAARDQLAAVPELDELMEARLRAKAVKAAAEEHASIDTARSRRRYRALSAVAGIAAALALVAGVAVLMNKGGSSAKESSSASAAGPPTTTSGAAGAHAGFAFGDAPDAHALAQSVASARSWSAPAAKSATVNGGESVNAYSNDRSAATFAAPCDNAARSFAGVDNVVPVRGTASIAGQPVEVYVFPKGGTNLVVVVTPDCKLVIQQVASAPAP